MVRRRFSGVMVANRRACQSPEDRASLNAVIVSDQNIVPRRLRNREVKGAVPPDPVLVVPDLGGAPHAGFDVEEILFAGLDRRDRGHRRLDHEADLEHRCRTATQNALVDADGADGTAAEKGAVAASAPNLPVELHPGEQMPQRTAADAELGGQLALRRQLVAVSQIVLLDKGEQHVGFDGVRWLFSFGHVIWSLGPFS